MDTQIVESVEFGLIQQIRDAFQDVRLEDGISLNMTEYHDSYGCATHFLETAKDDERMDWQAIPDETLESFTVTFCFTDLKGFRFYLPAYMIWTIRNHKKSNCIIGDFTIYAIDPNYHQFQATPFLDFFSEQQVEAMVAFLRFCTDTGGYTDEQVAANNLRLIESLILERNSEKSPNKMVQT